MSWTGAVLLGALLATVWCDTATALRDSARGTITQADDTEIVVTFGEHDQNRSDRVVVSTFCQLHWGVLSLGPDGNAIWKFEVSSLTASDRWQGQFVLHDKEDNLLGTVPHAGAFDVEVREVRARRMEIVMPLRFDPAVFKRIASVKMLMECRPKEV